MEKLFSLSKQSSSNNNNNIIDYGCQLKAIGGTGMAKLASLSPLWAFA